MNIPRQITVSAFYRCPSQFQLIGCQPSRRPRLFRNYSNPMTAFPSLCASFASTTIFHSSSSCKRSNSKYLKHQSCVLHQDVALPISSDVFHKIRTPPTCANVSSVDCPKSPTSSVNYGKNYQLVEELDLYSASCDINYVKELDSYSSQSKLLSCIRPQPNSLRSCSASSTHHQPNSGVKQLFFKAQPSSVNGLRHISCNPSCSQFNDLYSAFLVPSISLSKELIEHPSQQPIKSHSIQSRHLHPSSQPSITPSRHLLDGKLTLQPIKSSGIPSKCLWDGALRLQPINSSVIPTRNFSMDGFYTALSQSQPVQAAQSLLLDLHQWLPWWLVIPMATLAVRTLVVLPLAVHQGQVVAKLAAVNAEIGKLTNELNKEVAIAKRMYGWDEIQAKKVFKKQLRLIYQRAIVRDNCHPFKMVLLVAFQMPLWVCLSVSLRNLTAMANAGSLSAVELKSEGLLWFPDLTSPDPIFIPLMLLAVNLSLTEVHALRQVGKGSLLQKVMLNGSRVIIFFVAAAATYNPSSVTFYWLCSSTFGLCQSLLLMSPPIRRALGIPKMAAESATPYQDIANNLKKRLRR